VKILPKLGIAAGIVIAALLTIALAFSWHIQHSFSFAVRVKGDYACRRQRCLFTLGEIFPGRWDRVIVFDMAANQDEVDSAVGQHLRRPDLQRFIVFMDGSNVVKTMEESQDFERPRPDEVLIADAPKFQNHVVIDRNATFVMTRGYNECDGCTVIGMLKPGQIVE